MKKADYYRRKDRCPEIRGRFLKAVLLALTLILLLMPAEASAAKISKKSKSILTGQSFLLKMKGASQEASWSSSKPSVAKVNSAGVVNGKKTGTAVITATADGKTYTCKVTVRQAVTGIQLNKASVSRKKGKSVKLKAKVEPADAYQKGIVWMSSNSNIASVSSKGKVTAKSQGNAVITAKAKDGSGVFATCLVIVQGDKEPLVLSETSMSMYQNEFRVLSVSGSYARIVWGSSNQAVAAVGADGTVVAVGPGQARIVAMTKDGLQYAYCDVTVYAQETAPSQAAQQFLNILESYSQTIKEQKALGHFIGYSNSGVLAKNTWGEVYKDMTERGIGYTNCAHTIRLALRDMGRLGVTQNFWGDDGKIHFGEGVQETLEQSCRIIHVEKSADQLFEENGLLPGDICIWRGIGHTNVYAGNKLWYDTGRSASDGGYMTIKELKAAGVSESVLSEDIENDYDYPKLNKNIYIFNSLGLKGINLGNATVAYIIRLVK